VTLITGDRVFLEIAEGRQTATVAAADRGGRTSAFQSLRDGDNLYVIPVDAAPYIPQKLDLELFNVTRLVRDGYDDGSMSVVPLILTYTAAPIPLPDIRPVKRFESIASDAAVADKDGAAAFGKAIGAKPPENGPATAAAARPLDGIEKIWLDARIQASLQDSVPQIGAPSAWQAGLDGTGVTVAVLDTGIDDRHPDLVGKVAAAKNFSCPPANFSCATPDPADVNDRFGHGTHVASIAAGTGAASGGQRKGVAFGASLLNGKVLNDRGSGTFSGVMAGMQWAAAEKHAAVVNMSLGGGPTDGRDPVSLLVNSLTRQFGTLFVIAAGNAGGQQTVSTPGAADAALTVGAVDKQNKLAPFSSRGPRVGDFAIKPNITGPGVGIIAARAQDGIFDPVAPSDPRYTRLSGTSMATPHVAGAAALLRQKYAHLDPDPGRDAEKLKALLVSTAALQPDLTVYQQGGGRVDVKHAISTTVFAEPSAINIGFFPWPHGAEAPVTGTATYTNLSSVEITLDLAMTLLDSSGAPAVPGMTTLKQASVTVGAGSTASADVVLDARVGKVGLYSGYLAARQRGSMAVVSTPVGFFKEPEMYNLTVQAVARDGLSAGHGFLAIINVGDPRIRPDFRFVAGKTVKRIPPGTYSVIGELLTDAPPPRFLNDYSLVARPQVDIRADTTLVLDSSATHEIQLAQPEETARQGVTMGWFRSAATSSVGSRFSFGGDPALRFFASPTAPVTQGIFQSVSRWELEGSEGSSAFDLVFVEKDRIPDRQSYTADPTTLATVANAFHSHKRAHTMLVGRHFFPPREFFSAAALRPLLVPRERKEFLSAGDIRWAQTILPDLPVRGAPFPDIFDESLTTYVAGEKREQTWFKQPLRPSAGAGGGAFRFRGRIPGTDDQILVSIPPLVDAGGHRGSGPPPPLGSTAVTTRLFRNGQLIGQSDRSFVIATVPPDPADYRVEMAVDNSRATWATMSPRTTSAWSFRSAGLPPDRPSMTIPLLVVDYDLDVDLLNQAESKRRNELTLRVHGQGGAPVAGAAVTVQASFDDGQTWKDATVEDEGDGVFEATIGKPTGANQTGFVSLKVSASDSEARQLQQEIIRAFTLPTAATP
jgi:subtilisin family serine protease